MTSTATFLHDTEHPDTHPLPDGLPPVGVAAAQESIVMARVTGSVGASVVRDPEGIVATSRRLYTVEKGVNTATNLWQITITWGKA